jgi:hypothetical protein
LDKFIFGIFLAKTKIWLNIDKIHIWQNLGKTQNLVKHWLNSNVAKPQQNPNFG